MSLEAISVTPKTDKQPTRLLVALHGWGANAQDLASLASYFELNDYQMVFPNAPFPHYQVPGGRAWYALEQEGYPGLPDSRQILTDWLLSLEATTQIPRSRTVLAGFSQGGAMALDVGLQLPVAQVCSLSGYLHFSPQRRENPPSVLLIHGRQDAVVPLSLAQQAQQNLEAVGVSTDYREFEMGHEISPEALEAFQAFLAQPLI
ncbi:MAG: alpha/beta hydrolase-fold protein [Cyanobacteriota bacterium]|nr:alpha/beta hydrolase-fold protein [Cyanobacteriota bacterium]